MATGVDFSLTDDELDHRLDELQIFLKPFTNYNIYEVFILFLLTFIFIWIWIYGLYKI